MICRIHGLKSLHCTVCFSVRPLLTSALGSTDIGAVRRNSTSTVLCFEIVRAKWYRQDAVQTTSALIVSKVPCRESFCRCMLRGQEATFCPVFLAAMVTPRLEKVYQNLGTVVQLSPRNGVLTTSNPSEKYPGAAVDILIQTLVHSTAVQLLYQYRTVQYS